MKKLLILQGYPCAFEISIKNIVWEKEKKDKQKKNTIKINPPIREDKR